MMMRLLPARGAFPLDTVCVSVLVAPLLGEMLGHTRSNDPL